MRVTVRNFLKKAVFGMIAFLCIFAAGNASLSRAYPSGTAIHEGYGDPIDRYILTKIVSVLAIENSDQKMLDKATEKLAAMNTRDLHLISALCDRISANRGTPGAGIAFSLITAMIVFS
jgi:hypothetical protein